MPKDKPTSAVRRLLRQGLIWAAVSCPAVALAFDADERVRLWPDNLFGVDFPTADVGFISGYAGTVLRTDDGGENWVWSQVGVNELLRRIAFVDTQHGWAVGHRGSVLHTSDSGATWQVQTQQQNTYLRDVTFVDGNRGWAVGHEATILATVDGGSTWQPQQLTGFTGRDLPRLHAVSAIDASRAMLVGEFGVAAYTENGGATWQVFDAGTKKTLLSLAHLGDGVFLAGGLDGTLVRLEPTAARGASPHAAEPDAPGGDAAAAAPYTARALATMTTEHFFAVADAGNGRAVATGRAVLRLTDGDAVTPVTVDDSIQLPFTWFAGAEVTSDGQLFLVGIRGIIAGGQLDDETGAVGLRGALGRSDTIRIAAGSRQAKGTRP